MGKPLISGQFRILRKMRKDIPVQSKTAGSTPIRGNPQEFPLIFKYRSDVIIHQAVLVGEIVTEKVKIFFVTIGTRQAINCAHPKRIVRVGSE